MDLRQAQCPQMMPFAGSHPLDLLVRMIVEPAEMQEAVNDVERQLIMNVVATMFCLGRRDFHAHDNLTDQLLALAERER